MRQSYPSDISRKQFETISEVLEAARKTTKPRQVDLYDIFCAILFVLKSGCQWNMLPKDFSKSTTCYYYFQIWNKKEGKNSQSILEEILKILVVGFRQSDGRTDKTSFGIIDAQSVKNTDCAKEKGYDGGKKVSGIKRHIAVDTNGLPHAICVTTANVSDRDGALDMFELHKDNLSGMKHILVDGGYTGGKFALATQEILGCTVEIAKRSELHKFVVIPKRWVVERSFAWLEKCRRLWKNCERKLNTSLQMVNLAFIRILLKRI